MAPAYTSRVLSSPGPLQPQHTPPHAGIAGGQLHDQCGRCGSRVWQSSGSSAWNRQCRRSPAVQPASASCHQASCPAHNDRTLPAPMASGGPKVERASTTERSVLQGRWVGCAGHVAMCRGCRCCCRQRDSSRKPQRTSTAMAVPRPASRPHQPASPAGGQASGRQPLLLQVQNGAVVALVHHAAGRQGGNNNDRRQGRRTVGARMQGPMQGPPQARRPPASAAARPCRTSAPCHTQRAPRQHPNAATHSLVESPHHARFELCVGVVQVHCDTIG